jgi:NAD(P)-dependent dehydrogenase (short-subunit alcohol dehydrogenase family)
MAHQDVKNWLITGSSRGFGLALARAVLEAGDKVVATARRPADLDALVQEHADSVLPVALDVTDAAAARSAVARGVEAFGSLDVIVNNAGYANSAPIEEMTEDDFRAQLETNLFGVVNVTRAVLPVLRAQRSGTFVQFSSLGGRVGGTPGMGAYQTAKFAVEGFSEVLANEVAPFGVNVMIVEPGAFRTDWQGSSMVLRAVGPDYDQTVGEINRYRDATNGTQPGDPVRGAAVIIEVLRTGTPPRRLLLGAEAVAMAQRAERVRSAETVVWAEASARADYPPSTSGTRTASAPLTLLGASQQQHERSA